MKAGGRKLTWWKRALDALRELCGRPSNVHYTSVPLWKPWRDQLVDNRDDLASDEIEAFATTMWAPDFAVSVTRDQVRSFRTPMLVLPGVDEYHPGETGREIAALAPAAELLEPWKDPEHLPAATEAVGRFLRDHTPR